MPPLDVAYDYYERTYGGVSIAENEWDRYAAQSVAYLTRLDSISYVIPYCDDEEQAWSMALCAVADVYRAYDAATAATDGHGPVSSVSVGSVSTSYDMSFGSAYEGKPRSLEARAQEAASRYLHVYVGVDLECL